MRERVRAGARVPGARMRVRAGARMRVRAETRVRRAGRYGVFSRRAVPWWCLTGRPPQVARG